MSSSFPGQNGQGRSSGLGLPGGPGQERVGPLGATRAHDHPATRQRIEAQLVHRSTLSGASRPAASQITSSSSLHLYGTGSAARENAIVAERSPGFHGHRRTCRPCITSRTERPSTSSSSSTWAAWWWASSPRRRRPPPPPGCGACSARRGRSPSPCGAISAPGVNWAGRTVYGIPVFGFALLAMSQGAYALGQGWVLGGLALFAGVALLGEGVLWPAERRLQIALTRDGRHRPQPRGGALWSAMRRPCRGLRSRCSCSWWPGSC